LAEWLAARPHREELRLGGKRLLLVHSTPWEPRGEYIHPESASLARFAEAEADIVLYGHTHQQLVRRIGRVLVVNPGSAGHASDWHTGAMMMRLFADNFLSPASSIASPGLDELRWLKPVRPGDVLSLRVTILEARRSHTRPDQGVVRSLVEVLNQDSEVVMSL